MELINFEKKIFGIFFTKYKINEQLYYHNIIDNIIFNERTHLVSLFKDYLILDDDYEFLRRFYTKEESYPRIKKSVLYYDLHEKIYPNYAPLPESKLIYYNIIRKQNLHDIKKEKEKERKSEKENKYENKNDNIIFNSSAYNYIINQSNTNLSIFDIEKDNNGGEESINDINNLINTINKDENKIIIKNIYSNRTYNDKNFNIKEVENKQLVSSNIYKKNISHVKNKNNVFKCIIKPKKNKTPSTNQTINKTNDDKINKNQLNQNLIVDIDTKIETPFKTNGVIQQSEIKSKNYNSKNNIHGYYVTNENNDNFPKVIKSDSNYFTNRIDIKNKSVLSHSLSRAEYFSKYLNNKNFISKQINDNNHMYQNRNLVMSKSISESNFRNKKLHSFNKSNTPNRQANNNHFCTKNNHCLKSDILQKKIENNDIDNNLFIKEHLLTEEIPKIKVNMKPQKKYNKTTKRRQKTKNKNLLIEVNNFADYKTQKTCESELNFPITDKNIFNQRNSVMPYKKKNVHLNNTYNHMDTKTYNDSISTVIYLHNSFGIFPKLTNDHKINKLNYSTQLLSDASVKSPKNSINNKNNYTMNKDYNKIMPNQNEVLYERKKITKNKSFNMVANNRKENNNTFNNIDSIRNEIMSENNSLRNVTNNIPLSYKNTNEKKIKRSYYPIRLSEINFHNSSINNKTINDNKNNIDIFSNIMDRDNLLKIYDNSNNYNSYKSNNNIIEKNKTYINININNNIDINNKNFKNNPKNILNKTMSQKLKLNMVDNKNPLLGNKIQKIKEWKNRKIIDIIRESRLKYIKSNSINNEGSISEKKNKQISENSNSIKNYRNQNKKNNKNIKRQYTSYNDNIEIKNKFK